MQHTLKRKILIKKSSAPPRGNHTFFARSCSVTAKWDSGHSARFKPPEQLAATGQVITQLVQEAIQAVKESSRKRILTLPAPPKKKYNPSRRQRPYQHEVRAAHKRAQDVVANTDNLFFLSRKGGVGGKALKYNEHWNTMSSPQWATLHNLKENFGIPKNAGKTEKLTAGRKSRSSLVYKTQKHFPIPVYLRPHFIGPQWPFITLAFTNPTPEACFLVKLASSTTTLEAPSSFTRRKSTASKVCSSVHFNLG